MKLLGISAFALSLLASPGVASPGAGVAEDSGADPLSTQRRVHGVITSVEPAALTIATSRKDVTGKIDPARSKVTVRGKPARIGDLKVTDHAKAELCLDDVWLTIDAH
mgnify:CR=1 FL=1